MNPEDVHTQFRDRFRARDLDGLLALYEDEGAFMMAPGQIQRGKSAIREALTGFLSLDGDFELETRYVVQNGDIALLSIAWHIVGTDMRGQSAEVARRQPDGRWLYMLNHPFGGQ